MGPLQLTFVSVQPSGSGDSHGAAKESVKRSSSGSEGSVDVLFEVTPLHSTPANSEGWCSVPGWPLRCGRRTARQARRLRARMQL